MDKGATVCRLLLSKS